MSEPIRLLVVCTANICRSPAAERYLLHHAAERGIEIVVSSSGFLYDGENASDAMSRVMGERGFDLSDHRSRISTCDMVEAADLVVTMERRHGRDLALQCGPRGIYTLRGAVAALTAVDREITDPRARIEAAEAGRLHGDLLGSGPDEISDPFGKPLRVNRRTADELRDQTAELIEALFSTAESLD